MTSTAAIHLRAEDEDDLIVLSGLVQDMVARVGDMAFVPAARRFVIMGQRFRWEAVANPPASRIRSALRAEGVKKVRAKGFDPFESALVLNLLNIKSTPSADGDATDSQTIDFLFSEDRSIRLETEMLDLWLEDMGDPYPAVATPNHGIAGN